MSYFSLWKPLAARKSHSTSRQREVPPSPAGMSHAVTDEAFWKSVYVAATRTGFNSIDAKVRADGAIRNLNLYREEYPK